MHPTEGYVTTEDGVRLFFQTLGNGPETAVVPNGICLRDDFKPLADRRTLVFYDLRSRGRSDAVRDSSSLARGIHADVDDLEAVRRHFGIAKVAVIGHSYMGLMAILYAMKHGDHVGRVVQLGTLGQYHGKEYPTNMTNADATLRDLFTKLAKLEKERASQNLND